MVVIGGSAAGNTAAINSRRRNPGKSVILIRPEKEVLVPCGIPYIFGTLGDPEKDVIPDSLLSSSGIGLVVDAATLIDRELKIVRTERGMDVSYDKLVIATGSLPAALPIPGIDKGGVFASLYGTVKLLGPDSRRIRGFIINKFRGDLAILKPGLDMIEERTGKPVIGVLP